MENQHPWGTSYSNRGETWHRSPRAGGSGGRGGNGRGNRGGGGHYGNDQYYRRENYGRQEEFNPHGKGGFGRPQNYQGPQRQDISNNSESRSRPKDKYDEDRMRDTSPDRQERARPKDKQQEDHTRDPSPDRALNDQNETGVSGQNPHQSFRGEQSQWRGNDDRYSSQNQGGRHGRSQDYYNHRRDEGYDNQSDYYHNRSQNYNKRTSYQDGKYDNRHDRENNYPRDRGPGDQQNYYREDRDQYRQQRDHGGEWKSRREEKSDFHLSKTLSFILRHGAEKQGYKLMPGGFLYVDEILKKQRNLQDYTIEDVQRVVQCNDKQRFYMEQEKETGRWKIRANQGHTIEVENLDLKPLQSENEAPVVIHGTYMQSWEKIKQTGLSRMGRNHIHFAAGEPGENGVISGMRSSCEVMIYINLKKALEDGFKFFWSANNVILCAGNENGVIPPSYFEQALQRYPRQRLEFDNNLSVPKVPIGGESLVQKSKKKKKKGKGDKEKEGETKEKKEKTEIDESAVEDTGNLYDENMEVDEVKNQHMVKENTPNSWENEKFEDAVQDQEEEFKDAQDGPDVEIEFAEEIITIDDTTMSESAIDYLQGKDVVAVHCIQTDESFSKIFCVTKDKSYIFDIESTPEVMTTGKLSDFFNSTQEPFKVFCGLDSQTCAKLFDRFGIILDGTKLFDLKVAYELMHEKGLGNVTELKKTGFDPNCVPGQMDESGVNSVCQTYFAGYSYLNSILKDEIKDLKKQLFDIVNKEIDKEALKLLKEKKKKELKATQQQKQQQQQHQQSSKKKKGKGK